MIGLDAKEFEMCELWDPCHEFLLHVTYLVQKAGEVSKRKAQIYFG